MMQQDWGGRRITTREILTLLREIEKLSASS